jgi:hypothetical protein
MKSRNLMMPVLALVILAASSCAILETAAVEQEELATLTTIVTFFTYPTDSAPNTVQLIEPLERTP